LGLAQHPQLRGALSEACARHGGAASSRIVAGTAAAHVDAERALARHVALDDARVFSSAYAANVSVLGSLFGPADLIVSDALNHASIIDGCRLSSARVLVFRHGDLEHAEWLLRTHANEARVTAVVTETFFSMDGDIADVAALRRISSEHGAALIVDEAHALGVVGPRGEGVCAARGVSPDILIGGLGKALGLAGGFVAGSETVAHALDNFARPLLFSTALFPAIASAVPVAIDLVVGAEAERARLQRHATTIRAAATRVGWPVLGTAASTIIPVVAGAPEVAVELSSAMRSRGFLVPAMRPPTVPVGTSRLRWSPTAVHEAHEVARACEVFAELARPPSPPHRDREHESNAAQR
jgi:8-amino-7-oxononanoate synthase